VLFELTDDHEAFRRVVRDFADKEIAPHVESWDRDAHFPVDTVVAMGELGLFGLPFPEAYGGGGAGLTELCIAIEEIARVDQSLSITLEAAVGLGANPIFQFGTEEQRDRWLPDLLAGRALGAFGLTEPEAGSDAGATRTRAVRDEGAGEWVIDGEKQFITNSGTSITSVITVTAVTGAPSGGAGAPPEISNILIPAGTPGLEVAPSYRKLGWRSSDTHGLAFSGCRVPEANLLGAEGRGFANFLAILDDGRVAIAALALGAVRACVELCTAYANDRIAFGRPIGANQAVAFKVADMAVMAEAAHGLVYRAAALRDAGRPFKREAAIAKLYASEAAVSAAREATQIFGGAGMMDESPVARIYRDSKIIEVGEGTSEIQRLVISRDLGLPVT
jgi:butyryl-CoA dehydrogenase